MESEMEQVETKIDVLAVMDDHIAAAEAEGTVERYQAQAESLRQARAAIEELIEADKACDEAGAALRCLDRAGPRHGSYGTGWEVRDRAHRWDLERKLEAACQRRAAALARVGGGK
jgi:hypothetical protein